MLILYASSCHILRWSSIRSLSRHRRYRRIESYRWLCSSSLLRLSICGGCEQHEYHEYLFANRSLCIVSNWAHMARSSCNITCAKFSMQLLLFCSVVSLVLLLALFEPRSPWTMLLFQGPQVIAHFGGVEAL